MHCLIHIGVHKTGSTAFQIAMSRFRWQLGELGLLYPAEPFLEFDKFVCHHGLAGKVIGQPLDQVPAEYIGPNIEQLEQAIDESNPNYIVLSSEEFSTPFAGRAEDDPLIKMLLRRGCSISVVAMIRPQVELLQSSYIEGVMAFFNYVKFKEYLALAIAQPFFNYSRRLSPWTSSSKFSFVAVPYTKALQHQRLAETILRAGGIPDEIINAAGVSTSGGVNPNPGAMTVAAVRYLVPNLPRLQFDPLRDRLKGFVFEEAERRGWLAVPYRGYSKSDVDHVRKHFQKSNSGFAKRHWGEKWSDVFGVGARSEWKSNELDLETISDSVREELESFGKAIEAHLATMRAEVPEVETTARVKKRRIRVKKSRSAS